MIIMVLQSEIEASDRKIEALKERAPDPEPSILQRLRRELAKEESGASETAAETKGESRARNRARESHRAKGQVGEPEEEAAAAETKPSFRERLMEKRMDAYLDEHFIDYIEEYDLVRPIDYQPYEVRAQELTGRVQQLIGSARELERTVTGLEKRTKRLLQIATGRRRAPTKRAKRFRGRTARAVHTRTAQKGAVPRKQKRALRGTAPKGRRIRRKRGEARKIRR